MQQKVEIMVYRMIYAKSKEYMSIAEIYSQRFLHAEVSEEFFGDTI